MKGAADKILVNSKFTASIFRQTFKRLGHIKPHVLYPAINFAQYKLEGKTEGQKKKKKNKDKTVEDQVVFLSLNRYERKKNINLAIKAFAELKQSRPHHFPKLKLIIAGKIFEHILFLSSYATTPTLTLTHPPPQQLLSPTSLMLHKNRRI